jgi:hypothetical protein
MAEWASAASDVVATHIRAHKRSGDTEGQQFWQRVSAEIEQLDSENAATLGAPDSEKPKPRGWSLWPRLRTALRRIIFSPLRSE